MTFQIFLSLLNHASRKEKFNVLYSWCTQNLMKNIGEQKAESIIRIFETNKQHILIKWQ